MLNTNEYYINSRGFNNAFDALSNSVYNIIGTYTKPIYYRKRMPLIIIL